MINRNLMKIMLSIDNHTLKSHDFWQCKILFLSARTHLPVKLLLYLLNTVYPTGSCTYPYNFKILYPILNFRYDMFTRYVLITTHIIYYMIRYNKLCFKTAIAIHQNEIYYFLIWIRWHASFCHISMLFIKMKSIPF